MAIAKAVVERISVTGVVTERRDESLNSAQVIRYGTRTVDTGDFQFDIRTNIDQNDNIKYIQDIVDTDLLAAIWNFQLTTNDEGGYDHDGPDLVESRFVNPNGTNNTKKFQAQYILSFDESTGTDYFEITDDPRLDMTKQFDLYIWCQFSSSLGSYSTDEKAIIFSKYDGTNGGIEVGFIHKSSGDKRLFVRTLDSVGTPVEREGTQAGFLNNTPRLIRIKRDENNLVTCYLDGILELSFTEDFQYGLGENIRFGSHQHPSSPSEFWGGHLMQTRLYIGGYLSDIEADRIHIASPQPLTMKLAGKVWKIDDNVSPKMVYVKSHSKILIETNLTSTILSGTSSSPANRTLNVYDAGEDHFDILNDIITNVDSSFIIKEPGSAANATWDGKFVATGSMLQCTNLLLLKPSGILFNTPRRTIIIEDSDGIDTPYKFEQGDSATTPGFDVNNTGKDDSVTVNDLELVGRIRLKHNLQTFVTSTNPETVTLTYHPVNLRIVSSGGTILEEDTDYIVDFESKEITFTIATDTYDVEYDYEDLSSSTDTQMYFHNTTTGSSSITQIGKYAKRIFIPQLTHSEDFDQVSQKIIIRNNLPFQRYQVLAPTHLNHVRENNNINVINSIKNTNENVTIKSIEYRYPNVKTIIQLGEHRFDSFDLENIDSEAISSIKSGSTKVQNV